MTNLEKLADALALLLCVAALLLFGVFAAALDGAVLMYLPLVGAEG